MRLEVVNYWATALYSVFRSGPRRRWHCWSGRSGCWKRFLALGGFRWEMGRFDARMRAADDGIAKPHQFTVLANLSELSRRERRHEGSISRCVQPRPSTSCHHFDRRCPGHNGVLPVRRRCASSNGRLGASAAHLIRQRLAVNGSSGRAAETRTEAGGEMMTGVAPFSR
jgi:hypothetical protein